MIRQSFAIGSGAKRVAWGLVTAGAFAAAAGLAGDPGRTWPGLLVNGYYVLALALAGMVFIALQHLCGAAWSANMRRVAEAMMAALPIAALLMLALFFGRDSLYAAHAAASPAKARYLSTAFFFGRMALFVTVWAAFAWTMRRTSLRQDADPAPVHHRRLVRSSAAFIVVFAVSFSLASFDWLMTLTRDWSSTIFAIYAFAGLLAGGVAAITLTIVLLLEAGYLEGVINENHLHDLGKLLFAFSTFWAYIWVSQYLLIWYGNLPDETPYYLARTGDAWITLFLLNVVVNWVVPFLVLMPRASKRNRTVLKWIAIVILAGRWLDLYLSVMPGMLPAPDVRVLDVVIAAGYASAFFLIATRALASAPLVPLNNPSFSESLGHHQ
jgi:hypothetical protein